MRFPLLSFFPLGWPLGWPSRVHELWEAHWDMLSLLVGLEQVAVESGLLNHGCMNLVASSELLLEVRVAVDHTSECWLLSVGGWLGPLVEEPHGWKGGEGDPDLWLHILSVSMFLSIQQGIAYTQALFRPWSGMAVISGAASRGGELRRAHGAKSSCRRGRLASEGEHCVIVELSFEVLRASNPGRCYAPLSLSCIDLSQMAMIVLSQPPRMFECGYIRINSASEVDSP